MKLLLKGHEYKFAVEQIMITMFPDERPEYVQSRKDLGENGATVSLSRKETFSTATTTIQRNGHSYKGEGRIPNREYASKLEEDSDMTHLVKTSFYRAARLLTEVMPVWGSLTGIRPAKIATKLLEDGMEPEKAVKEMAQRYFVTPERGALCVQAALTSIEAKKNLRREDISLYIGIPFCPTRCAYCSFVSNSVEKSMKLVEPYLEALYLEIEDAARRAKEIGLRVKSVYYGGGTPTTLSAKQISNLMEKVEKEFDLSGVEEYTVEAGRPDTVDTEKFRALRDHGVTRVSINPQTMRDDVLRIIGRNHTGDDIRRAYDQARSVGFSCINMDLIAGLPGDDPEGFRNSLDEVAAMGPENITVHTLALKKGSRLRFEGREKVPEAAQVAEMVEYSRRKLIRSGYEDYYLYRQKFTAGGLENVGWSRKGHECLYNIYIMEELHTILSLGAGATTKLVDPDITRIERIFNPKYPYEYIQRISNIIKSKDYMHEYYDIMKGRETWSSKSSEKA